MGFFFHLVGSIFFLYNTYTYCTSFMFAHASFFSPPKSTTLSLFIFYVNSWAPPTTRLPCACPAICHRSAKFQQLSEELHAHYLATCCCLSTLFFVFTVKWRKSIDRPSVAQHASVDMVVQLLYFLRTFSTPVFFHITKLTYKKKNYTTNFYYASSLQAVYFTYKAHI